MLLGVSFGDDVCTLVSDTGVSPGLSIVVLIVDVEGALLLVWPGDDARSSGN